MTPARFRLFCALTSMVLLPAAGGTTEIFFVHPTTEAEVVTDENGFPTDLRSGQGVGDSIGGSTIRTLYTFDLSFLPPGTQVLSASIEARIDAVYGDPGSLGPLLVTRVAETRGAPSVEVQARWATNLPFGTPAPTTGPIEPGSLLFADLSSQFRDHFPSPEWSLDPGRAVVRFEFAEPNNGSDRDDFIYLGHTLLTVSADLPSPISERPRQRHLKRCIPVVASQPGAAGTSWTTELHITANRDSTVWLYFTETGTDGTTAFQVRRVDLDSWETVRYGDVLPDLFGLENTMGWIEVFTTNPDLTINSRVANVGGVGSYGQTIPMIDESEMLRLIEIRFHDDYRREVNLIMMDSANRTNIGFVNLSPTPVTVRVIAISPDGPFLGDAVVALEPFGHRQINRLETLIPETGGAGLISLSFAAENDGSPVYQQGVAAYASRVDNITGDAVFVLP